MTGCWRIAIYNVCHFTLVQSNLLQACSQVEKTPQEEKKMCLFGRGSCLVQGMHGTCLTVPRCQTGNSLYYYQHCIYLFNLTKCWTYLLDVSSNWSSIWRPIQVLRKVVHQGRWFLVHLGRNTRLTSPTCATDLYPKRNDIDKRVNVHQVHVMPSPDCSSCVTSGFQWSPSSETASGWMMLTSLWLICAI